MSSASQYYYQKELEASIARRKKQRRLIRIAQLEALDDQKRSACAFCHRDGITKGWKFRGTWKEMVLLDEVPAPFLNVCQECYDTKYGTGRNESQMMRCMKVAPTPRLLYHLTINKDACFAMNHITPMNGE